MDSPTKTVTVSSEISLFDIPFFLDGQYKSSGIDNIVKFTVRVGDKTLGEVLKYIVNKIKNDDSEIDLGIPWNVIKDIRLDSFAFEIEFKNGEAKYGFSYSNIGIDLTFLQIDKLEIFYTPKSKTRANSAVDVNIFGTFLGVDFTDKPISWDALKEQPPTTPGESDKVFELDYLGLGQRVTLRNISELKTIGAVIDALKNSYDLLAGDTTNPIKNSGSLTYNEAAAWLVGAKFSVLEMFDFSGVWNLPTLAGARIGLRGERAKSLAGFEFEILYRRIADDLGEYHIELVLPDVLRRFQAGIASVTLPIISIDIYTDGGFKLDLGFPRNMDFSRSFTIELIILGVPVIGSLGMYFGVLSAKAVPEIPKIVNGSFKPVIVAGAGFRIGVGKSFDVGILKAGIFIGIEGLLEGIVAFYEPFEKTQIQGTFYKVSGHLQLSGHIWGEVDFVIIKGAVDLYAYVSVQATFESYRATLLVFEAGVRIEVSVRIGYGWFSFTIDFSFGATIREEILIGEDTQTPWLIDKTVGTTLVERIGPVAFRPLPNGEIIADEFYIKLLNTTEIITREFTAKTAEEKIALELYFYPSTTIGIANDHPENGITDNSKGVVNLVAVLLARLSRKPEEKLSPAEAFACATLNWGLSEVNFKLLSYGCNLNESEVTLSALRYLACELNKKDSQIPINIHSLKKFFEEFIILTIKPRENLSTEPVTPFPMIPFLTLETGSDQNGITTIINNFETEPMCSVSYQQEIAKYFDALSSKGFDEKKESSKTLTTAEDLSMAGLIFVDSFKLVLKKVVNDAIAIMSMIEMNAEGASLLEICQKTGLNSPAGFERVIKANIDNKKLFSPDSFVKIVAKGRRLDSINDLNTLAGEFNLPLLTTAKHISTQNILAENKIIKVKGGTYLIQANDTKKDIEKRFGVNWEEIKSANPFFDWSVPREPKNCPYPYPTLELPAGSVINLPVIEHLIQKGEILFSIAEKYNVELFDLISDMLHSSVFPMVNFGMAYECVTMYVLEGDTIDHFANRALMPDVNTLFASIADDPNILPSGTLLKVPPSKHIIAREDTLAKFVTKFQTSIESIVAANPGESWKFIPRFGEEHALPMGVTINIPAIDAFQVSPNQSFASIARIFGLKSSDLIIENKSTVLLKALAAIILPPLDKKIEGEVAPSELTKPYALNAEEFITANQGVSNGQGSNIAFNVVRVPDCEKIELDKLISKLSEGKTNSSFALATKSLASFLMAGLRLPAVNSIFDSEGFNADVQLYPLYCISRQQWPAPVAPTTSDWISLVWNSSENANNFITTCVAENEPLNYKVNLTQQDIELINAFNTALADILSIQPIFKASKYPSLEQIPLEIALGSPTEWSNPSTISFLNILSLEKGDQIILLHAIPNNLRKKFPHPDDANELRLNVYESNSDPLVDKKKLDQLTDIAWATRVDIGIRGITLDGDPDSIQKHVYEMVSCNAQGQDDLTSIRKFIKNKGASLPIDLYILYPGGDLTSVSDSLRSDLISDEIRPRVALLKSNLSTFSKPSSANPADSNFDEISVETASATLAEPAKFLELLWQISVTNSGGFFLDYNIPEESPGFPSNIFNEGKTGNISIIVVIRKNNIANDHESIPPRQFHNILITAENLHSKSSSIVVSAEKITIQPDSTDETKSQSLESIATENKIEVGLLGLLNASTPNILIADVVITGPKGNTYTVQPGDDLLTVSLILETEVENLSRFISSIPGLLYLGAKMEIYPNWVTSKNKVEQPLGGFRVLRNKPVEIISENSIDMAEAKFLIENLFYLAGYGINNNPYFYQSPLGLPIAPLDPDSKKTNGLFALKAGDPQPWIYQRLLPITKFAKSKEFELPETTDPYAELGNNAEVAFGFQDIFGNKLPRPPFSGNDPQSVEWPQLYRDQLMPVHSWPSITLSYDFKKEPSDPDPLLITRIKFACSAYCATVGLSNKRRKQKINTDRDRFATIYYQVANRRVESYITSSLMPGTNLNFGGLNNFSRSIHEYLGTIAQLNPTIHIIKINDNLDKLGDTYGLDAFEIARHISEEKNLLNIQKKIFIPRAMTVLPNMSVQDIIVYALEKFNLKLSPSQIGKMNSKILLTPEVCIKVGSDEIIVKQDQTLESFSDGTITPAKIAAVNTDVKGLYLAGMVIDIGIVQENILADDTLSRIAIRNEISLEQLAATNSSWAFFRTSAEIEIPLHIIVPAGTPNTSPVENKESIQHFVTTHHAAIRDVLSANADNTGLLVAGQIIKYPDPVDKDGNKYIEEIVKINDTLSTITLRFSKRIGDPSLKPADVGTIASNAQNVDLLTEGSVILLPPIRLEISYYITETGTNGITITELSTTLHLHRDKSFIDPEFINNVEVLKVSSRVSPRLSSDFSKDDRGSLRAFAKEFQKIFYYFKLATGSLKVNTTNSSLPLNESSDESVGLIVVKWDSASGTKNRLYATIEGPAYYYAPRPLLNKPWNDNNVTIYQYVPGSPLFPGTNGDAPFQNINFQGADLERWAQTLLQRIDRLLLPDMAPALRLLSPEQFHKLIEAKYSIANAIANRVGPIIEQEINPLFQYDQVSAKECLMQQLLVELSSTFRGGIVVQYNVDASSPEGYRNMKTAPRLLCSVEPAMVIFESATLDSIAEKYSTDYELAGKILQNIPNILKVGADVNVGEGTKIKADDTICSISVRLNVSIDELLNKVHDSLSFLASIVKIPISYRTHSSGNDDTFISLLERLATSLMTDEQLEWASKVFIKLNGTEPGVFRDNIQLPDNVRTKSTDTIISLSQRLNLTPEKFIEAYLVESPLLAEGKTFKFISLFPSSNISASKIVLDGDSNIQNKFNFVYITPSPDQATNVSLRLGYKMQGMEYNIANGDDTNGYQSSDWMTFLDWEHGEDLGDVSIPIPNRQFPLPPTIMSHQAIPEIKNGQINPDKPEEIMFYDYLLNFTFDAASQDELYYSQHFNSSQFALDQTPETEYNLAKWLAQYQAIDNPLWEDLFRLTTFSVNPPGTEEKAIVLNAVQIFTELSTNIGIAWANWYPKVESSQQSVSNPKFRIRRHHHPDGRIQITCYSKDNFRDTPPQVRLVGRNYTSKFHNRVQSTIHNSIATDPIPIPKKLRGNQYEVKDKHLSVLREQNCWGIVSVTRNENLVSNYSTSEDFILHLPGVRAMEPVAPQITVSQRLNVANGLGTLESRLKELFESLLFPDLPNKVNDVQISSVTACFARPVVENVLLKDDPEPDDSDTLLAPVIMSPILNLAMTSTETLISPSELASQLSIALNDYLQARNLSPHEEWSLTLKVFSNIENQVNPTLLLEILDLRLRMSQI